MKGNKDPEFFNMINNSFIWLISSAIQYYLWDTKTGEAVQKLVDFKYETAQYRCFFDVFQCDLNAFQM